MSITMTDYVARGGNSQPSNNCIQTSGPICSITAMYDDSRTVANNDDNTSEVHSTDFKSPADCDDRVGSPQGVGDLPGINADNTGAAEGGDSSIGETLDCRMPFHHSVDSLIGGSADMEPANRAWLNFEGDRVLDGSDDSHRSSQRYPLVHADSSCSQSKSPVREEVSVNNAADARSSESSVIRRRRISATRSALYRRLLSSETAGSSDTDFTGDIFDLQSLSSSSDDDDAIDVSDLNVDSGSDHSYLVVVSVRFR